MDKASTSSTKGVGGADDKGESDFLGDLLPLKGRCGCGAFAHAYTRLIHLEPELFAVFGCLDGFDVDANNAYTVMLPQTGIFAFNTPVQRCLTAHGRKYRIAMVLLKGMP